MKALTTEPSPWPTAYFTYVFTQFLFPSFNPTFRRPVTCQQVILPNKIPSWILELLEPGVSRFLLPKSSFNRSGTLRRFVELAVSHSAGCSLKAKLNSGLLAQSNGFPAPCLYSRPTWMLAKKGIELLISAQAELSCQLPSGKLTCWQPRACLYHVHGERSRHLWTHAWLLREVAHG